MQEVDHGGKYHPGDRQRQHARAHSNRGPIKPKDRPAEATRDKREAEDEQQVPQDTAGNRSLDQIHQSEAKRRDRNDQLGRIAEGGVQQPTDGRTAAGRQVLGRLAHVTRQGKHGDAGDGEQDPGRGVEILQHDARRNR